MGGPTRAPALGSVASDRALPAPGPGHLGKEVTVEDPGVLAKPWTFKQVADLAAGEEIREFICAENNRDVVHMVGK